MMFSKKKKLFKYLIASFAVLGLVAGCANSGDAPVDDPVDSEETTDNEAASTDETLKINLVTNNTNSSLLAVVADEKGFFEEEGLDVDLTQVVDISKIPETLGNQYDIGFGVEPLVIRGAAAGLETVVLAGNGASTEEAPFMVLMARPDAGINSPEDFVGKRIAGPTLTGTHHISTVYWLQKNGVEEHEFDSVQVATPAMIDQLQQGQIDVAELQEPYITEALRQGLEVVGFSNGSIADESIESLWIAKPEWAESNEESVKRFRAGLNSANEWLKDPANTDEAKEILANFTEQDIELVKNSPILNYRTEVNAQDLENWAIAMKAVSDFDANVDYESLIYPW